MNELVAKIIENVLSVCVFSLVNVINLGIVSYQKFPQLTTSILILVSIYLIYKQSIRIIRVWIRMIWFAVKLVLFLLILIIGLLIFSRGKAFFDHDIPNITRIYNHLTLSQQDRTWSIANLWGHITGNEGAGGQSEGIFDSYGIEIDTSYLDYMKRFEEVEESDYERIHDFVSEGMETFEDLLEKHGSKLREVGNRFFNS